MAPTPLPLVLRLDDPRAADRATCGGKAAGLSTLIQAGISTPPGFVLTCAALGATLDAAGLRARAHAALRARDAAAGERLAQELLRVPVPSVVTDALARAARGLRGPLAVRSSAPGEDGAHRSSAGRYASEIGVTPAGLLDAVRRVWASRFARDVVASGGGAPDGMAVVVQPTVDAAVAGVLFTIHPVTGSWREMVVEAVWGLGGPLVAGAVIPHQYVVRRPSVTPASLAPWLARLRMRTLQADLPPLLSRVDLGPEGLVTTPVPGWQRHVRTLADPLLHRLARAGLRAAAAAGQPVDVEWAVDRQGRIWLLQCRPITSRPLVRDRADVLWTRRFFGERWTDPVTPMGWSIVEPLLTHFIAYPRTQAALLGGGAALRLIDGRPYLNATVFRHLAFKLPGAAAPQFMLELLPPDEELAWRARFAALPDLPVVAALLRETAAERRWERFAWNPWTNPARWRAFADRVRADLPGWRAPRDNAPDLVATIEAIEATLRAYIGIHVLSLLYAALGWQALRTLLDRALPDDAANLHTALAVSPPGNRTLDAHQALWELAREAAPGDLDALAADEPTSPRFARALAAFVEAWGHRADASWELFSPRWSEGPERFLPQLRQAAAWSPSPSERAHAQESRFNAALADVVARTTGPARAATLATVHLLRRYLLLRENQRELFEQLMAALHDRVVDAGRLLAKAQVLARAEDVAYLTWPEARAMLDAPAGAEPVDPAAVRRWVMRRRTRREEARLRAPPIFLRGDGVDVPDHAGRWSGLGVSPGRAQGVVRVLRSPADARRVGPGDVVVARAIDPSWTSLFLSAGAVVCELGGALSHGAVLAREYGLPMVVNLADATTRLRDGQEVTVDGARGMVFVHG